MNSEGALAEQGRRRPAWWARARPGWKVLRVLAQPAQRTWRVSTTSDAPYEVLAEASPARAATAVPRSREPAGGSHNAAPADAGTPASAAALPDVPPYQVDVLVRGSEALGKTKDGRLARDVI